VGGRQEHGRSQAGAACMTIVALVMGAGACLRLRGQSRKIFSREVASTSGRQVSPASSAVGAMQAVPDDSRKQAAEPEAGSANPSDHKTGHMGVGSLPTPVQVLGALLAPPAAAVGLVLYLATRRQEMLLLHFGIDPSLLNYSVQDYLLRSADVLAVALLPAITLAMVAIAVHSWVQQKAPSARTLPLLQWGSLILRFAGCTVFALALTSLLGVWRVLPAYAIAPSITISAALAAYGGVIQRRLHEGRVSDQFWVPWARGILYFALIFIGVFLTTEDVAEALGRGRAELIGGALYQQRPGVILYSDRRLYISGPGVTESQLQPPGSEGYSYRYDGLRLLVRSGDRLVLLPSGWTVDEGNASIVRDDNGIRVEMSPPGR
jgi:hypothetical protein